MIKKAWLSFLKKSIIFQFFVFLFFSVFITITFSLPFSLLNAPSILSSLQYLLLDKENGWVKEEIIAQSIRIVYQGLLIFLLAIWQAVLIFRLMLSKNHMRFSSGMAFYDSRVIKEDHARETKEQLVFRLMNIDDKPLFNVKITAIFRYHDNKSKTYQHYHLNIPSNEFTIFEPGMPFRIYIDIGLIKDAVDEKYLFNKPDESTENSVELIDFPKNNEDLSILPHKFMIMVESFDPFLDKISIIKNEYNFNYLTRGRFKNIQSIDEINDERPLDKQKKRNGWDYFYPEEINANFDKIIPVNEPI